MFGAAVCKLPYSIAGNFPVRTVKIGPLKNFPLYGIRESVDSLCRIGADTQYMQYLSKIRITSPQIR